MHLTRFCAALVLLVPSVANGQAGRHPDRRYVDQSIPVTTTVRLAGPRSGTLLEMTRTAIATIGREDGAEHFLFGEIAAAAMTRSGDVVVVDRRVEDVRLFSARGQFLQQLGRKGQGPGEFRTPHSVLVTPTDEIWISDMQRRLTVFTSSPDGYKLSRTIPVELSIRSMCLLGNDLVANAVTPSDPYVLRILDAQARPTRSFGTLYTSPNAMINLEFAQGRIACDNANDLIVYASPATIGEVRAYRRDGQPVWRVAIDGLLNNIISDTEGGGLSVERSASGAHTLLTLLAVPGVGIVVQYAHRTPEQMKANEMGSSIVTIVIDPRTGGATLSSDALPRLGAVSTTHALAFLEDPTPRIEIRALRRP
jgi:hypothetical protein